MCGCTIYCAARDGSVYMLCIFSDILWKNASHRTQDSLIRETSTGLAELQKERLLTNGWVEFFDCDGLLDGPWIVCG